MNYNNLDPVDHSKAAVPQGEPRLNMLLQRAERAAMSFEAISSRLDGMLQRLGGPLPATAEKVSDKLTSNGLLSRLQDLVTYLERTSEVMHKDMAKMEEML